jgi:hypothetical protein
MASYVFLCYNSPKFVVELNKLYAKSQRDSGKLCFLCVFRRTFEEQGEILWFVLYLPVWRLWFYL